VANWQQRVRMKIKKRSQARVLKQAVLYGNEGKRKLVRKSRERKGKEQGDRNSKAREGIAGALPDGEKADTEEGLKGKKGKYIKGALS